MARMVLVVDDDPLVLEVTAAMLDEHRVSRSDRINSKTGFRANSRGSADRNINH